VSCQILSVAAGRDGARGLTPTVSTL